jgi:hypothetical protein
MIVFPKSSTIWTVIFALALSLGLLIWVYCRGDLAHVVHQ